MADEGQKKTDKEIKKVEDQIKSVYGQAQKEIEDKLKNFEENFKIKKDIYYQKYKNHEITQKDYNSWRAGQLFQMEQWKAKRDQICDILHNANEQAANIVNGGTISAFAGGANWTAYTLEHGEGVNFGFGLYDTKTVTSLIKDNPQILPKWKIDEPKEYVWNKQKVNNCVTQGIVQGESLQDIGKRIAEVTCNQNMNLAMTHAQTAMGGAQNAGRMQRLQDAKKLGMNVVKEWMATLDEHTRDSHAEIDGEQQPVGDKWHHIKFSNGCEYPCDPNGPAHEVFNCRCTLVGDVTDYPDEYQRYDNIDGEPIDNMTYKEWEKLKFADKVAAQNEKEAQKVQVKIDAKQQEIDAKKQEITDKGADHEFKGIWAGGTKTYADWDTVKDSIPEKIKYYEKNSQKHIGNFNALTVEVDDYKNNDMYSILASHSSLEDLMNDPNALEQIFSMTSHGVNFDQHNLQELWSKYENSMYANFVRDNNAHIEELMMFLDHGEEYSQLLEEYQALQGELKDLQHELNALIPSTGPFDANAYTQERKDDALWAKSPKEADAALREGTGEVWRNASDKEKDAIYDYTGSYHKFNEPLRGIEYGTNAYKGVGGTDLNAGRMNNGEKLNAMTDIIDKCTYDQDMWLQRGCRYEGMDKFFNCDLSLLISGTQEELERELLGTTPTEYGFMSCGSSKGRGFSGSILLNVYAPSGTKMMYVEPFSQFGNGSGRRWDGKSTQSSFGGELETILQQGTQFRITKIERHGSGGTIYFDLEVIDQSNQQRWEP